MRKLLLVGLAISGLALSAACVAVPSTLCEVDGWCGGGDGGTVDSPADAPIDAPVGCDLSKDPKDSPLCIADSVGVFVDATKGDDAAGDGSKLKPLKTIGKALEKAGNKPRIYICEGTYAEDVVLDAAHAVSLVGGLKCADWSYSGVKAVVGKGTLALKIDSVTSAVVIADLDVKSADGAKPGESSVAAFVNASDKVTFLRAKLEAGIGVTGANGTLTTYTFPAQAALNGNDADGGVAGGDKIYSTCPGGGTTKGGGGGISGFPGTNGEPDSGVVGAGKGGDTSGTCAPGVGSGANGGPGFNGANGPGATVLGVLSASAWVAASGQAGGPGGVGQGGGGGGGYLGGSGGGGGAGGCGGAGGSGGGGGGSSVALLCLNATVNVSASELSARDPGNGGSGVGGQGGQSAAGIGGNRSGQGCLGGNGAAGGNGGSGGGGAGGISVGVLWKGTAAPSLDSSTTSKTTVAAKGGTKGIGGAPGTNDGIDGVAQAVLEVK